MSYTPPEVEQGLPTDDGNILRRFDSLEEFVATSTSSTDIEVGPEPPESPSGNQLWIDTDEDGPSYANITASSTAPSSPTTGDLWVVL